MLYDGASAMSGYKSGVATIIRYNFQCSPLVNPIYQQLSRKRMFLFTCIIQIRLSFSPSLCMRVATVFRTHVVPAQLIMIDVFHSILLVLYQKDIALAMCSGIHYC